MTRWPLLGVGVSFGPVSVVGKSMKPMTQYGKKGAQLEIYKMLAVQLFAPLVRTSSVLSYPVSDVQRQRSTTQQ